ALWPLPRAQAARARSGAARGLGRAPPAPGAHPALLRLAPAGDRLERLRPAAGRALPPGARAGLPRGVPRLRRRSQRGALAIVLHTHMPYVEGFGTWPFGEEWLWEAIVGSYLPVLELLDRGAELTLSLTPVLCDQLEAPRLAERLCAFVGEVRRRTHAEDAAGLRAAGEGRLAGELERAFGDYERALQRLQAHGGDLLGALGAHAQW